MHTPSHTQTRQPPSRRRRSERGQAMLEYSLLNWFMIVGLVMGATVRVIPGPVEQSSEGRINVIEMFLVAYQIYHDSFYYVLNLPYP